MTFMYNNDEYRLVFRHKYLPSPKSQTLRPDITRALLSKTDDTENYLEGHSICHEFDNPCKALGQKIALTRLLDQVDDLLFRETVWKETLEKFPKMKKVSVPRR